MNFIEGVVQGGDLPTLVTREGLALRLPGNVKGLTVGCEVIFGFRPQHLTLDPAGVPADIVVIEPTGAETQVNVRVGETPVSILFHDRVALHPGEKINILPDLQRAHVFDKKTGLRIH
jgi:multiple sugar transport system ATP-binding protein